MSGGEGRHPMKRRWCAFLRRSLPDSAQIWCWPFLEKQSQRSKHFLDLRAERTRHGCPPEARRARPLLSRDAAGEKADPGRQSGEAGEGLLRGGADRGLAEDFGGGVGDGGAFEEVGVLRAEEAYRVREGEVAEV